MIDAWCGKLAGYSTGPGPRFQCVFPGGFQRLQAAGSAVHPTYYRRGTTEFYLAMTPAPLAMSNSYFLGLSA